MTLLQETVTDNAAVLSEKPLRFSLQPRLHGSSAFILFSNLVIVPLKGTHHNGPTMVRQTYAVTVPYAVHFHCWMPPVINNG
jgi:hypothetical protein